MTIAVYGAGAVGCYVGGRLAAAGQDVVLVGRPRIGAELAAHGLRLTDHLGADLRVPAVRFTTGAASAAGARLVLVTVKSAATGQVAAELAGVLAPGTVVVSFQNGVRNAGLLADRLPAQVVLAGMVPFNVQAQGDGRFHQGTEGKLDIERHPALAPYAEAFAAAGLPLTQHADLAPVQWAKLLINLNNPVNALSGLPLRDELAQRDFRRCLAAAQSEALAVLRARGIRPARLGALPPRQLPALLRLPDAVFTRVAARMLAIDPLARSSMWDDLRAGRRTEIDHLNGEIVHLARTAGRPAPVNTRLVTLIRAAETGPHHPWSGPALYAELTRAR